MSWLSNLFHSDKPYKEAQNRLENFYNQGQSYIQPYQQYGQQGYENLTNIMNALLHPESLQDQWIKNYQESGEARNAEDIAGQRGLDAASTMGLLGSRSALDAIQQGKSNIALQDRQNYLNDLMQKYLQGAGIATNLFNTGASASNNLANNALNMGQNEAQLGYNQQASGSGLLSGLLGLAGSLGAGALSGPLGGALAKRWNLAGGS